MSSGSLVGRVPALASAIRVRFSGGRITEVAPVDSDCDMWILPGLIDIQVNGYAGHDVNAGAVTASEIESLVRTQWRAGVTAFCPTIITGPEERITDALAAIARARAHDPLIAHAIPCAHVEGPYLAADDGPRGAHAQEFLRNPDAEEFQRWQNAARGRSGTAGLVGIVTIAPELPGAIDYIRQITEHGVIAAIGHTAATSVDIAAASAAGASLSTHLGNGAHAMLPRHPNYIWDQLADDRLCASFIADGHHLSRGVFLAMLRAKGLNRSMLVSDATALAGMPPGHYRTPVGGEVELTPDGRLVLAGTPLLAGATRNLTECVAHAVGLGLPIADVVTMAAGNPARLLRLRNRGSVAVGHSADLTVVRAHGGKFRPVATVVAGTVVHSEDSLVS